MGCPAEQRAHQYAEVVSAANAVPCSVKFLHTTVLHVHVLVAGCRGTPFAVFSDVCGLLQCIDAKCCRYDRFTHHQTSDGDLQP